MTGVVVKVMGSPLQVGLFPEVIAILTDGTKVELIVMVIPDEVAVAGLAQVAFEVITQVTTCPLVNDDVVNVAAFVPAFVPSTFH
ncbi:hypothetical protein DSECCO2_646760 [anaerobic digester metagenome]